MNENKEANQTFDVSELRNLQEAFGIAHSLYLSCVDTDGETLTPFSGTAEEREFIDEHLSDETVADLLQMLRDGDPEDVVTLDLEEPYLLLRGVAMRDREGILIGKWLLFGVDIEKIPDDVFVPGHIRRTTELLLDQSILLLTVLTEGIVENARKVDRLNKTIDEERQRELEKQKLLTRNEVMTDILKCMDMDTEETFAGIAARILTETKHYLELSDAYLLRRETDGLDAPFFTGRPYTVSTDAKLTDAFAAYFEKHHLSAGVFLPVTVDGKANVYACFVMEEKAPARQWSNEDVRFLNDVKRILQNVLARRLAKKSLENSHHTLEALLNDVGCGIAVIDLQKGAEKVTYLYRNNAFREIVKSRLDEEAWAPYLKARDERTEYHDADRRLWYELTYRKTTWVDGRTVRLVTVYDITERKLYQNRLERISNTDTLTELFEKRKEALLNREKQEKTEAKQDEEVETPEVTSIEALIGAKS